ncbi:uncharacterized protein V1518DRAFT_409450 [Limtongia smithiae]|uniref:uncharacterized protein n=1 Tax=Limtongia smithiae TaxID=1125753 RepID=UPI0034CDAC81
MTTTNSANGHHDVDTMDAEPSAEHALQYLKAFTSAQATRTELYHEFESAINDHADGRISVAEIQQVIRISQEGFQDVSSDIILQERSLQTAGLPDLSAIIRRVQDLEEEKLRVTVGLLSCKVRARTTPDISFESEIEELEEKRRRLVEEINEAMEEARAEMLEL